jgi:hypothetical protein
MPRHGRWLLEELPLSPLCEEIPTAKLEIGEENSLRVGSRRRGTPRACVAKRSNGGGYGEETPQQRLGRGRCG